MRQWREALIRYFASGIKNTNQRLLGLEAEHFIVDKKTGAAVPYAGEKGVRRILAQLMEKYPDARATGEHELLGFVVPDFNITLEPAAQLEISVKALEDIESIGQIYRGFRSELDQVLSEYGYIAVNVGCQPVSRVDSLKLIPKQRYALMDQYFAALGTGGMEMMRGTASVQVSIDYTSEADFRDKIQATYYYGPVLKLLCDNSTQFQGNRVTKRLLRTDIWRRVDPARCGVLPNIFSADYGFSDYADFLGAMPPIFLQTGDQYIPTGSMSVQEIFADREATEGDILHMISMAFPDVRLKNFLELRFADCVPLPFILAFCALVKGLLYGREGLDYAQKQIRSMHLNGDDVLAAENDCMEHGWDGLVYGESAAELTERMLAIAQRNLEDHEKGYLDVFRQVIRYGSVAAVVNAQDLQKLPMRKRRTDSMRLQEQVYEVYKNHIHNHMEENRQGAAKVRYALEHSPLFQNNMVDKTVQIPKVFDEETIADFRKIAGTAYGIFGKVIREYCEHEDYRRLFPFSRELEELILLPAPYQGFLPIARFDIFYNEETGAFTFCEINTDGTAAMLRDLEMRKALIHNPAHQDVVRQFRLEPFELFDTWVHTFMSLYQTYPERKEHPNVAIVDFLENATMGDFEEFARRFQKEGIPCEICDIRKLEYRDGILYSETGNPIDAIYRRAVTADIVDHFEEVQPFLNAVKDRAVFLAGAFATQIIHSKWLFHVLHLDRTMAFLTEEEQRFVTEHIPKTVEFSEEYISLEEVVRHKDRYIIKPMDAYASKGVYAAGHEYSQDAWSILAAALYGKGHICQTYCPQYLTDNIDFAWGDGEWHPYINMQGLYVYNGEFTGVLMRMACGENIIVAHENERTVPVFTVKQKL